MPQAIEDLMTELRSPGDPFMGGTHDESETSEGSNKGPAACERCSCASRSAPAVPLGSVPSAGEGVDTLTLLECSGVEADIHNRAVCLQNNTSGSDDRSGMGLKNNALAYCIEMSRSAPRPPDPHRPPSLRHY